MLGNLEHACRNFARAGKTKDLAKTTAVCQAGDDVKQQKDAHPEQQERKKAAANTPRLIAREDIPDPRLLIHTPIFKPLRPIIPALRIL